MVQFWLYVGSVLVQVVLSLAAPAKVAATTTAAVTAAITATATAPPLPMGGFCPLGINFEKAGFQESKDM